MRRGLLTHLTHVSSGGHRACGVTAGADPIGVHSPPKARPPGNGMVSVPRIQISRFPATYTPQLLCVGLQCPSPPDPPPSTSLSPAHAGRLPGASSALPLPAPPRAPGHLPVSCSPAPTCSPDPLAPSQAPVSLLPSLQPREGGGRGSWFPKPGLPPPLRCSSSGPQPPRSPGAN